MSLFVGVCWLFAVRHTLEHLESLPLGGRVADVYTTKSRDLHSPRSVSPSQFKSETTIDDWHSIRGRRSCSDKDERHPAAYDWTTIRDQWG